MPLALQWQVTDVSMPPIAWAALGNFFSLCPSSSVSASHGLQLGVAASSLVLSFISVFKKERELFSVSPLTEVPREIFMK